MTATGVAWRHSLLTRLLLTSITIAVLAVTATAWLATRTTTQAIEQEQNRSLADEAAASAALTAYATTHRDWSQAGALVKEHAQRLGRRVTLTDPAHHVIADSQQRTPGWPPKAVRPLATIDPLRSGAEETNGSSQIDPRVVGPFRLTKVEAGIARRAADDVVACLARAGVDGRVVVTASGRSVVETAYGADPKDVLSGCVESRYPQTFPSERRALAALRDLVAGCLGRRTEVADVLVQANWRTNPASFSASDGSPKPASQARVIGCLEGSRRTQLTPYAAPPALLFITDASTGQAQPRFALSAGNITRIVTVTATVLLVTILLTVVFGRRLVRPLRALTEGAATDAPPAVGSRDEIGVLAMTLTEVNRRRGEAEAQRRAMVGDIAHELRNPITNIRSWLEAAQDGLATVDGTLIDLLHEETSTLQHIVADLADLAAADAGTLRVHPEILDVGGCLGQVAEGHAQAALAAQVSLRIEVAHPVSLCADPVRLRQLIGNLVANGIRHTPPGGNVTLSAVVLDGEALIRVSDTGRGIAPEHLPRVFERFWRADESRSRSTGGSGLGLAIAQQLAHAHHGSIQVASSPGNGATFTVRLPTTDAPRKV